MENDRKRKRVALFVGVDDYQTEKGISPLSCAVEDAKALKGFFEGKEGQFDRVEGLENPTSEEVSDRIDALTDELEAGDLFLFYFAGHGTTDNGKQQLLCRNSRVRRGVPNGALCLDYVAQPRALFHTAVVLDACRTPLESTRGGQRTGEARDLAFVKELVGERMGETGSLTVLCSCDEKMSAGELPRKGHGLFTLALLEVLRKAEEGHRRLDFNQELSDAVGAVMQRIAREERQGENQRPWIQASGPAPVFLRATLDTAPLLDWVDGLAKAGKITRTEAQACCRAIEEDPGEPWGRGLFEVARYFSDWDGRRDDPDGRDAFAGSLIKTLCGMERPHFRAAAAPAAEPASAPSQREAPESAAALPLSRGEREALRRFCASLAGGRREKVEAARSARTGGEAVRALDELTLGWVETYGRGNALGRGETRPIGVRVSTDGQALATELRRVDESIRTPVQAALLRTLNAALSMGCRN